MDLGGIILVTEKSNFSFDPDRIDRPEEIRRKVDELTYNVAQVAKMLGCGPESVRELCKDKAFPAIKLGKGYKIPKAAFEEWLHSGIFATKQNLEASGYQRNKGK